MTLTSWRMVPYHVKDDGALTKVASGQRGPWELQYMPYKYVFEDFEVWRCETCHKLIDSDISTEYSYRFVDATMMTTADDATNVDPK